MNWFNGGFWGWIFLKTKSKWILRVPNKVVEQINSLFFYILSRVLCARGCYFWVGLFSNEDLQKQSGYYSQIIKETRDHITGCKAKLIVPAIGEGSSQLCWVHPSESKNWQRAKLGLCWGDGEWFPSRNKYETEGSRWCSHLSFASPPGQTFPYLRQVLPIAGRIHCSNRVGYHVHTIHTLQGGKCLWISLSCVPWGTLWICDAL